MIQYLAAVCRKLLMEADWEVEVGADAPVIDGLLGRARGSVTATRERAMTLPESRQLAGLAKALIQLNSAGSPVWTSKCDVWAPRGICP